VPPWGGQVTDEGDGSCLLRVTSDSLEWLTATLAMLGGDGQLLEASPGLTEHLGAVSRRLGRLADQPAASGAAH
jgi:hypothetical protein